MREMQVIAPLSQTPPGGTPSLSPEPGYAAWDVLWGWGGVAYLAFVVWMVLWCVRHDPERGVWLWIILLFHPIGAAIYFLARWLPGANLAAPRALQRLTRARDLNRLEIAARQIGNAHQFIELGDALRETGQWEKAVEAYLKALKKDPDNLQAMWGAASGQFRTKQFPAANEHLARLMGLDPTYKFGDVSLLYAKSLHALGRSDDALAHLEGHIRRWRHPEALHLLSCLYADRGQTDKAREQLQALIMDIEASPAAIARKQSAWKGRAKKMLRRLPTSA
jgi:hypothetical protein